jgi:hypothetical protein
MAVALVAIPVAPPLSVGADRHINHGGYQPPPPEKVRLSRISRLAAEKFAQPADDTKNIRLRGLLLTKKSTLEVERSSAPVPESAIGQH